MTRQNLADIFQTVLTFKCRQIKLLSVKMLGRWTRTLALCAMIFSLGFVPMIGGDFNSETQPASLVETFEKDPTVGLPLTPENDYINPYMWFFDLSAQKLGWNQDEVIKKVAWITSLLGDPSLEKSCSPICRQGPPTTAWFA